MNARVFIPVDKDAFYRFIATEPEGRYEFERGRIVQQMTGGTWVHGQIARRISVLVEQQLDTKVWSVQTDRGVETRTTIRYGDVVVEAVPVAVNSLSSLAPALIVEVLSPSSVVRDLDMKPAEYLVLGTLQAYIVASQKEPVCLAWLRGPDGSFAAEPVEFAGDDVITIAKLGVAVSIADIYRGIALNTQDPLPHG
jgi:Uma2 family endonuclease